MSNKLSIWYKQLHLRSKLLIKYFGYFIIWFSTGILLEMIWDEKRTIVYHFFYSLWMAFIMTLWWEWFTIRKLLKKNNEADKVKEETKD